MTQYAKSEDIPQKLSDLAEDTDHRTVTDKEKETWNTASDKVSDIIKNKVYGYVGDIVDKSKIEYADDTIYTANLVVEKEKIYCDYQEIGKIISNDFYKIHVNSDSFAFRLKSSAEGIILLYSLTDSDLKYAVHVYKDIRNYKVDFGKVVNEDLVFTSVTMPDDNLHIIRGE